MLLSTRCMAAEIILHCSYDELVTSTNGSQQDRRAYQIIRLGDDIYQIWSEADSDWGGNQCRPGTCHFDGTIFLYGSDNRTQEGGYILRYTDSVTFDRGSGHYSAEFKSSTTAPVTEYEVETTFFDNGQCLPVADPAVRGRN